MHVVAMSAFDYSQHTLQTPCRRTCSLLVELFLVGFCLGFHFEFESLLGDLHGRLGHRLFGLGRVHGGVWVVEQGIVVHPDALRGDKRVCLCTPSVWYPRRRSQTLPASLYFMQTPLRSRSDRPTLESHIVSCSAGLMT